MHAWFTRSAAAAAAALLFTSIASAQPPDLSGVWSPPFRVHSSGLPLFGGVTIWMPVSAGDPKDVKPPTLEELSVRTDASVRTHNGNPMFGMVVQPPPPLNEAGQSAQAKIDPKALQDLELACYPVNVLARIGTGPVQIVQGRGAVAFVNEAGLGRTVFLDGRSEADALPQWSGHSVARWDGDTLKVMTTKIRGDVFGARPWPISDDAKIEEDYRLTDGGRHLVLRETFEDPKFYKEPLRRMVYFDRVNEEVTDYTCTEGKADMIETVSKGSQ